MGYFSVEGLSMSFGGLKALKSVSFEVRQGEFCAIIGPNGAGKSTMLNCLSRFYSPQEGSMHFKGSAIESLKPHDIAGIGIGRTFQNIELFNKMTVLENLLLGRHTSRKNGIFKEIFFLPSVRRHEIEARQRAEEIIEFLNLQHYRDEFVGTLPYGIQKTVELGRALMTDPELLLLDEPTSGLNIEETEDLSFWIEDLLRDHGITFIVVEHNMKFVTSLADQLVVLNFGELISKGSVEHVLNDQQVIEAYLGEDHVTAKH